MATVKKIVKAQTGRNVPKGMVESEMNPGKMIPKSKSNYYNGEYTKMLEGNRKATLKEAAKKAAPKKKMREGGRAESKSKSFPDLNKDGKITKADILKGRGVIAKNGAAVKKQAAIAIAMKKEGKTPKKKMQYGGQAASMVPTAKSGKGIAKCKYGCK